jgi:hypothetical protein
MVFKLENYSKKKHKKLLQSYLQILEKHFEYIPFIFSIEFINILSQFKDLFIIIEKNKITNLGYKNKIKNHIGFLFETPKHHYEFLESARTIATIWVPKEKKEKLQYGKIIEFEEVIINAKEETLNLDKNRFSKLRKIIGKVNRNYPELVIEEFDKRKFSEEKIKNFYDEWENITKERKSPYMFLYHNYVKFIYKEKGDLKGIVAKYNGKIIGISFFTISPLKKQSIGISCNGFHTFRGLNDFLAYESDKLIWKKYKAKFVNTGPCGPGEVVTTKEKFSSFKEKFLIAIEKGADLENEYFWYNDALDPDDFNQGQYG